MRGIRDQGSALSDNCHGFVTARLGTNSPVCGTRALTRPRGVPTGAIPPVGSCDSAGQPALRTHGQARPARGWIHAYAESSILPRMVHDLSEMGRGKALLRGLTVEFGMNVVATLFFGLVHTHLERMGLGVSVVTHSSDLP